MDPEREPGLLEPGLGPKSPEIHVTGILSGRGAGWMGLIG